MSAGVRRESARHMRMAGCGNGAGRHAGHALGRGPVGSRGRLRADHRGIALPSALMLAAMMLTTSAAWLEASIAHRRYRVNVHEHLRATQAADGALALCERDLRSGVAPVLPAWGGTPEQWTKPETFDSPSAYEPVPSWPGSARAPQCVIEASFVEGQADARAYWITARGFGSSVSVQARLQLMIMTEAGRERRAWRRIVAAPAAR